MAKKSLLSIAPKSEFTHAVPIPSPDRAPDEVEFTFKFRDREALDAWIAKLNQIDPNKASLDIDVQTVMDCVVGWELEDEFCEASLRQVLIQHTGAAVNIYQTYIAVSRQGKQKNL